MPVVTVDANVQLHYTEHGEGDETIVLSHSYLVDHRHFEPQIEALKSRYRVLAYDHRGHGRSDKPPDGYSMERIYGDGVAFLEALDTGPVHWIGLSTGGFVGMRIALRRPELLRSLVLMDTAADGEPVFNQVKYRAMFLILRAFGVGPVLDASMKAMFGRAFLKDPDRAEERARWRQRLKDNDFQALIGFGKAIFSRDDVTNQLARHRPPHPGRGRRGRPRNTPGQSPPSRRHHPRGPPRGHPPRGPPQHRRGARRGEQGPARLPRRAERLACLQDMALLAFRNR